MTTYTSEELRDGVVHEATRNLGHDYRDSARPTNWPPDQFDCSTFVRWCYTKFGIDPDRGTAFKKKWPEPEPRPWHKYPGYTMTQLNTARKLGAVIPFSKAEPGDALYYSDVNGRPYHHVVIFRGHKSGRVTHAAGTAYGVITSPVVKPGQVGHGNKKLVGVVSLVKLAKACGVWEADAEQPPVDKPTKDISLSAVRKAFKNKTRHRDVRKVRKGLKKVGLKGGAPTGKAGNTKRKSYAKWQRRLGYSGNDANGIPGKTSLKKLAKRIGHRVVP